MNILKQYATMSGLSNGNFDGQFKLVDIIQDQNFGLGTFDAVDGELIGVDGEFYRLRADGTVEGIKSKDLTPFASLTNFINPVTLELPVEANKEVLLATLQQVVNPNRIYALKVSGKFSFTEIRSLVKQTKPYVSLLEASKTQTVFSRENEQGTIIGWLSPTLFNTIMVEGLHLHFINDERNFGGHLLNFKTDEVVKLEIIEIDELDLALDQTKQKIEVRQDEVKQAEN